tara:strand:+ start:183 stop:371 length:189 start_codon:yes stop_codon:yes gene_type:complete
LRFKLSVYDHIVEAFIATKIIDASSISSAAKLAEIHFEEMQHKNKDVTLSVEELKNDIKNNS